MADQDPTTPTPEGIDDGSTQPQVATIAQYIKDMSVENPNAPAVYQWNEQPQIDLQFNIGAQPVNDEIWLPSVADINLSVRVLLVSGVNVNQKIESYDYRKFSTEVKDAKVGESSSSKP